VTAHRRYGLDEVEAATMEKSLLLDELFLEQKIRDDRYPEDRGSKIEDRLTRENAIFVPRPSILDLPPGAWR
jgi:hypothetical protein